MEQDGLRGAENEHKAQKVEPGVPHHGSLSGLDEFLVGKNFLPKLDERAQDKGSVHRFSAKFRANQQPGHHQQDGIDDRNHQRHLHRQSHGVEHAGDHHGKAGDGPHHQVAGHEKIVHGGRCDKHANGHDYQFLPKFESSQRLNEFFFDVHSVWLVFGLSACQVQNLGGNLLLAALVVLQGEF